MSGRTTPSGIRPPSASFGTPGTPGVRGAARQHSGQSAHAHPEEHGSPVASTSNSAHTSSNASTSVKVALRIRPPPSGEAASSIPPRFQRPVVHPLQESATQLVVEATPVGGKGLQKQAFTFDRVLGSGDGQTQVFETVEPLVQRFLEGYNVTVLAYGQTSSGKSYTMGTDVYGDVATSDSQRAGIIPRAVKQIFSEIQRRTKAEQGRWKVEAKNSYIEIYNEDLIDLLAGDLDPADRPAVTIREDKAGHILWTGLREMKVGSVADVMRNLETGSAIRQTGSTAMNDQSSRSHAIFSLTLTQRKYTGHGSPRTPDTSPPMAGGSGFSTPSRLAQRQSISNLSRVTSPTPGSRPGTPGESGRRLIPRPSSGMGRASPAAQLEEEKLAQPPQVEEWTTITSKLHFVDLAGSERLKRTSAIGDRAKEGISINAGLSALGNVISALGDPVKARNTTHIPYRDSKLTRLLQDSLGGNAHTLMIACVSPVEYNLSETLNTLKYANRARNIKNQATLNEVEVGWDDVEHLQSLVTKLRAEMASLKAGHPMPSISEEPSKRVSASLASASEYPKLQEQLTELSRRYAKVTAELAKAQQENSGPSPMSAESFAAAVEPVVEEYEKSISALESQLSLTKAALALSEEEIKDKESGLLDALMAHEAQTQTVAELKVRLAKLVEREGTTEAYVRDLEARLNASADADENHTAALGELKREIVKHRETEQGTEAYIKDLEARLGRSEEAQLKQKAQIEALERDVTRREKAYEELEARLALLDTSEQHKELLAELDARDKKMLDLQSDLEKAKNQIAHVEREASSAKDAREAEEREKAELKTRLDKLEKRNSTTHGRVVLQEPSPASSPAPTSLTPPLSPALEDVSTSNSNRLSMAAQMEDLQKKHDLAIAELSSVSQRYKETLRELEQLQGVSSGPRLRRKGSSLSEASPDADVGHGSPTSSSGTAAAAKNEDDVEELHDSVRDTLNPTSPPLITPTRANRASRRSMPLSPRGSFLGRAPVATSSASHLRSVSLSQELLLAQSGSGSANGSGLPQASGPQHLSTGMMSPRSTSPMFNNRRDSLLFNGSLPLPGDFQQQPERSNESLVQEVKKLEQTLNEREEEIRQLEASLAQLKALSPLPSPLLTLPSKLSLPGTSNGTRSDEKLRTPDISVSDDPFALSPNTLDAFNAIKASLGPTAPPPSSPESQDSPTMSVHPAESAAQQLARLDDLMLSMAKKEVAHRSQVDELESALANVKKAHDELRTLSNDQVHNMSTEIEALRTQIGAFGTETIELKAQLDTMQASLKLKDEEIQRILKNSESKDTSALQELEEQHAMERERTAVEHQLRIREIEEEHAALLQRMLEAKEELFIRKANEHDAALQSAAEEHQRSLASSRQANEDTLARLKSEHEANLKRKEAEHAEALQRVQVQLAAASSSSTEVDGHGGAIEQLVSQHHKSLAGARSEHEQAVQGLKDEHAAALAAKAEEQETALAILRHAHEEAVEAHKEELKEVLERGRADASETTRRAEREKSAELLQQLEEQHQTEIFSLRQEHEQSLSAASADREAALSSLATEHAAVLEALQSQHEASLASRREENDAALADVLREREVALAALAGSHNAALQELVAQHTRAVTTLKEGHERTLVKKGEQHESALASLREELAGLRKTSDAAAESLQKENDVILESLKASHAEALEGLSASHQSALTDLQHTMDTALSEQKASHDSALIALRDVHSGEVAKIQAAAAATASSDVVSRLERSLSLAQKSEAALGSELQEALDALSTLEKALIESQDERERLQAEAATAHARRQRTTSGEKLLHAEIAMKEREKDTLKAELRRMQSLLQKQSSAGRPMSPAGLGIAGIVNQDQRRESMTKETLTRSAMSPTPDASDAGSLRAMSPQLPPFNGRVSTLVSSHSSKPPPTPPPSMPPPPLPTEATPQLSSAPMVTSSVSSSSTATRASVSSVFTRDSHIEATGSTSRTMSVYLSGDTISVDPRVHQKLEEQESSLRSLGARLTHCETELRANIDLVTALESALNDSERNLRKVRIQMTDMAKERDLYANQNAGLRTQMQNANAEAEAARLELERKEAEAGARAEAQRRAQKEAQANAEQRMLEMQRINRKSKFNCF